jgi:preprotein translocase subunit Sss1
VGRKKFVRTTEPRKPPPEKPDRLEQLKATKVAAALLTTVVIIGIIWILWRDIIRVGGNSDYVPRAVLTVVGILILIGVGYRFEWTGFEERDREKSETGEIQRRKTLWDWMDLLLVPLMIAGIASWFTWWQNNSQQGLEARQRAQEAERQAQYSALQAYLDQMSQLMFERDLLGTEEGDAVFTLAQARTTAIIGQSDEEQN